MNSKNITWHTGKIHKETRQQKNGHKSAVLWLTGLSGSGKSTLAAEIEEKLFNKNIHTYRLDGDNIRFGLNRDLGFSKDDRAENIRRIGEVSKLFVDAGLITLTSFISPYKTDREIVRNLLKEHEFIEIYVKCDIDECERRDPKGLYKKARNGEIKGFTGIDAPYEEPESPDIIVETDKMTLDECAKKIIQFLQDKKYFD